MRFREVESMILKDGWYQVKQKGSHHQYKHPDKPGKGTYRRLKPRYRKINYDTSGAVSHVCSTFITEVNNIEVNLSSCI